MKKFLIALLLSGTLMSCVYAQYNFSEIIENLNKTQQCWERKNYQQALRYAFLVREGNRGNGVLISIVSDDFMIAMLYWNLGNKSQAITAMQRGIRLLQTSPYTKDSGCEVNAMLLLQKMQNNTLSVKFTWNDTFSHGVLGYIMALPEAVWEKRMGEHSKRLEGVIAYLDGRLRTESFRAKSVERQLKQSARMSYYETTKDTFSPNQPPAYGTEKRRHWEACKRVHDLF